MAASDQGASSNHAAAQGTIALVRPSSGAHVAVCVQALCVAGACGRHHAGFDTARSFMSGRGRIRLQHASVSSSERPYKASHRARFQAAARSLRLRSQTIGIQLVTRSRGACAMAVAASRRCETCGILTISRSPCHMHSKASARLCSGNPGLAGVCFHWRAHALDTRPGSCTTRRHVHQAVAVRFVPASGWLDDAPTAPSSVQCSRSLQRTGTARCTWGSGSSRPHHTPCTCRAPDGMRTRAAHATNCGQLCGHSLESDL